MSLHVWAERLAQLLAPWRCLACDEEPAPRSAFCAACEPSVLEDERRAGAHAAAFEYGGAVARAITRFKYEGEPALGVPLGGLAARALCRVAAPVDLVTHVPLHARRLASRGFDQAALLAREVARAARRPMGWALLGRVRDTEQQARMGREERSANVRDAFVVEPSRASVVRGRSVLLVDDVRTTGATLAACADALALAGARRISTLVLARDV